MRLKLFCQQCNTLIGQHQIWCFVTTNKSQGCHSLHMEKNTIYITILEFVHIYCLSYKTSLHSYRHCVELTPFVERKTVNQYYQNRHKILHYHSQISSVNTTIIIIIIILKYTLWDCFQSSWLNPYAIDHMQQFALVCWFYLLINPQ